MLCSPTTCWFDFIFPVPFKHQEADWKVEWVQALLSMEGPGFKAISACALGKWLNLALSYVKNAYCGVSSPSRQDEMSRLM